MLWLIFLISACNALHYYTHAGTQTCFYRELTADTLLTGKFKMDIQDPATMQYIQPRDKINTGMLIIVEETFNDNHRVVHQRGIHSGVFTFSALESGEHRICFTPKSFVGRTNWLSSLSGKDTSSDPKFTDVRVSIDFEVKDGSFLTAKTGRASTGIDSKFIQNVNSLNDKLIDIKREQIFIREKEWLFRDQSERTCETVTRWLIVQAGAVLLTCLYQVIALYIFFKNEKKKRL